MVGGRPVQTVIIDRHEIFRRGLRDLLEETGEFVVVGEGGTVAEARRILETEHPDVMTIDVELPDGDGLQFVREGHEANPSAVYVLIGEHSCDRTRLSAVLVGADGFVDKDDHAEDVVDAFLGAVHGEDLFGDGAIEELLTSIGAERDDAHADVVTLDHLTPQEARVFELVGQGLTNREVASLLALTEKTVKNYVSRVLAKLGMDRRTEIAVLATRLAVIADHEDTHVH